MLNNYIDFIKWFNVQFNGGGNNLLWNTLTHNGVLFPPEYEYKKIPIILNGKEIILNKEAEEALLFYIKYLDSEYIKSNRFTKNFWHDFKRLLKIDEKISNITDIDMKYFIEYQNNLQLEKEKKTKEDKIKEKELALKEEEQYKIAFVDGKEQPVGNFRIEPPGIFLGRGCHPKLGKIKKRIYPEDITINIGRGERVPIATDGRKWKEIIHDKTVLWLASWKDNITEKTKYVRLGDKSDFKSESDRNKFELARKLKKKISEIRKYNESNLSNDNLKIRQLATALYFIENFSLRVGNEKNKDEADTVGVSSLRVEHINLLENNKIKLDFLGKDSVRYVNKIEVTDQIYENLKYFSQNKNKKDGLFDKISPSDLNSYLQDFMKHLTSKVFRTMNASKLFQKEINKINNKFQNESDDSNKINLILNEFNKANAKVALMCNHQKNINRNYKDSLIKINDKIKDIKKKRRDYENKKELLKQKGKDTKAVRKNLIKIELLLKTIKSKKNLKIEMKNVSLGTSKINYIDPRITISFMKRHNIDINKLFTKTLQEKFSWALDVDENFIF
jgi:DNA topoisomerase-1